jgi:hypothetical protein
MKCYSIYITLSKINIYLGSSLSNSYLSDHEPTSPTFSMHPHYHQYRSTNNNNRGESHD